MKIELTGHIHGRECILKEEFTEFINIKICDYYKKKCVPTILFGLKSSHPDLSLTTKIERQQIVRPNSS